jgi:CBS domain containing-hemolysin-like protein
VKAVLDILAPVVALVVALACAAFCAGAETGFFSLNRGRILYMAREGSKAAQVIEGALRDLARTIAGLLVGNNLAAVAFSVASAALAKSVLPDSLAARASWSVCAACAMLALGEFLPKLLCASRPMKWMLRLAGIYRWYSLIASPLATVATAVAALFGGGDDKARDRLTPDDLLGILRDRKNGVRLTDFESALIARIMVLRKKGEAVTAESLLSALDEPEAAEGR